MTRLESDYYDYMRFDPEHNRTVVGFYVAFFEGAARVLELAPGRGEFMSLLAERNVEVQGVDVDEGMVAQARGRGLDVVLDDAVEFVAETAPEESYDGVFAAHFLEHLTSSQVETLLRGVHRVLRPGGRFVTAVPNPACYSVLSHDFWRDPTHERFYDGPLLDFLCAKAGLTPEKSGGNPNNAPGPPPDVIASRPSVDPGLEEAIAALAKRGSASRLMGRFSGASEAAHLIGVLSQRLAQTQEALSSLWRAHDNLLKTLYQPNEIYVVARK